MRLSAVLAVLAELQKLQLELVVVKSEDIFSHCVSQKGGPAVPWNGRPFSSFLPLGIPAKTESRVPEAPRSLVASKVRKPRTQHGESSNDATGSHLRPKD